MKSFSSESATTCDTILGLDISTSCTGYAIISGDVGRVVEIGYFKIDKFEDFFEKCDAFRSALSDVHNRHVGINKICIEENLQAFRPGMSSAKTINTLARFNGAASLIAYEVCNNLKPTFLNATSARSKLGIKLDRKSEVSTKQQIFEFVKPHVDVDWPMTKTGNINTACYDMADAYVLARAGWLNKAL
jgi:hypothetical protein